MSIKYERTSERIREFYKCEKFWKYMNIILIVIINLMCLGLMLHENFWYDEAYTIGMIRRSFSDIISTTAQDVHPPLYYFLLKAFYTFPGMEQMLSVKYFSWLFYLGYLILGSYICGKHYNRKVGFFWLILSGFMAPMMVQATSPRMYAMALFCVTLALYLIYLAVNNEKNRYWIAFAVMSAIAMWLHTFCMIQMFVLYAFLVCWSLIKKKHKILRKVLLSGVAVSIVYVPWLIVLCGQFRRWAGWETGWSNHMEEFGINSIKDWLAEWFSTIENPSKLVVIMCALVFFVAGISAVIYIKRTKDYMSCFGIILAGTVVIVATIVTIAIVPCFSGRYIFPLFGSVFLFVAVGMDKLKWKWLKFLMVCVIVGCGIFTYSKEIKMESPDGLGEYCAYIEANLEDDDLIMADSYTLMMMSIYYPEREYMIWGSKPPCLPFEDCGVFTEWEQLEDEDVVWYLSLANFRCGGLDDKYEVVEEKEIKFYYYDLIIEKYVKKE